VEPMIKGYAVLATSMLVVHEYAGVVRPEILEEGERNTNLVKPIDWLPREAATRLWSAIAASRPTEQGSYMELVRVGREIGQVATSSFLKLLLKVLTPAMFASKFPDFWARDHQGSRAVIESMDENGLVIVLHDVAGFDHIGPIEAGWVAFTLEAIGQRDVEVTCSPWSLAEPGPAEVRIEARWRRSTMRQAENS
jgi:hypothetical protein